MTITNIHDAKSQLSKLLEKAAAGEEVIIAKAGKPVARLIAYAPLSRPRQPGFWKGKVKIARDFDALPEAIGRAFQGSVE